MVLDVLGQVLLERDLAKDSRRLVVATIATWLALALVVGGYVGWLRTMIPILISDKRCGFVGEVRSDKGRAG